MKLKVIESIIDSVDPYQIIKDSGFSVVNKTPSFTSEEFSYFSTMLNNNELRIFNASILNIDLFKNPTQQSFYAGSGLDFLAHHLENSYDKALDVFFKLFGQELKTKLIHAPSFIKGIIKNTFIKRHAILNETVRNLFSDFSDPKKIVCKSWLNKHNIDHENMKGFLFAADKDYLKKYLLFIYSDKYQSTDAIEELDLFNFNPTTLCSTFKISDSDAWIVIPYFSNFHKLSFLKIINPTTNEVHFFYIDDTKLAYAGLYSLPRFINTNSKIRLVEDTSTAAILISNSKKLLNTNINYLSVDVNRNGISNPSIILGKPLFLKTERSDFNKIKLINDILPNFFICEFINFTESEVAYTWESFVEKEFKNLLTKEPSLTPTVKAFMSIVDINSLKLKKSLMTWLKQKNIKDVYDRLNNNGETLVQFKKYNISVTNNGYIVTDKKDNSSSIISNFIIKINTAVLFSQHDDMLLKGQLIMGENEYPLSCFKSELIKRNAVENIAIRAFASYSTTDALFTTQTDSLTDKSLPTVIDKQYNNALATIVNMDTAKAICVQGHTNIGWNKTQNTFASPVWIANSMNFNVKKQYFFSKTSADSVFEQLLPDMCEYKNNLNFLNKNVKDVISLILIYLYRTYYNYSVKPAYVLDSKYSRNMLKFIFAALGQMRVLEFDPNDRLMRKNKQLINLNNYPLLMRSNKVGEVIKLNNYPYILFVTASDIIEHKLEDNTFSIDIELKREEYPKLLKFTVDTMERFFKWMFNLKTETFDCAHDVKSLEQLLAEGNTIFDSIWWDEVKAACNKCVDHVTQLTKFMSMLTLKDVKRLFAYAPLLDAYILKRQLISDPLQRSEISVAFYAMKRENVARHIEDTSYMVIDKSFLEYVAKSIITKDMKTVEVNKLPVYVPGSEIVIDKMQGLSKR